MKSQGKPSSLLLNDRHMKTVSTILVGLGTVNLGWLRILQAKGDELRRKFSVDFKIVAVADSSGVAVNSIGWSVEELLRIKAAKKQVKYLPGYLPGIPTDQILNNVSGQLVIESSPANIVSGEPGLSVARAALAKGISVVFANKTPLVFAFHELRALCEKHGSKMAYSATV